MTLQKIAFARLGCHSTGNFCLDWYTSCRPTSKRWLLHTNWQCMGLLHRYFLLFFSPSLCYIVLPLPCCIIWLKWQILRHSFKTDRLKQPIPLFIMWTTIILVKSTNNLVFLTNVIVEPILLLVHLTQSLLHLNHNLVSLTNIMVVHIMNNRIGCFN